MTPTEAFDPNRESGDSAGGEEDEGEEDEEENEKKEKTAAEAEAEAENRPEGAEDVDPMSEEKMKEINKIKEAIQSGKLKGNKLQEALKTLGFSESDVNKLQEIKVKGNKKKNNNFKK